MIIYGNEIESYKFQGVIAQLPYLFFWGFFFSHQQLRYAAN